jgi:hypothetical protein
MYAVPPIGSTATFQGALKAELTPGPSIKAAWPLPASVPTLPEAEIIRMRLLALSATSTSPVPATKATPMGLLKDAEVLNPSANAGEPEPARVLTWPTLETTRMR